MEAGREAEALRALASEIERIRRFGFTDAEIDFMRERWKRWIPLAHDRYLNGAKRNHVYELAEFVRYGIPLPSRVVLEKALSETLASLDGKSLHSYARELLALDGASAFLGLKDDFSGADYSPASVLSPFAPGTITVEAYEDYVVDPSSLAMDRSEALPFDARALTDSVTELNLRNGARVLLMPSFLEKDVVRFLAIAPCGLAALQPAERALAGLLGEMGLASGAAGMDAISLGDYMERSGMELGFGMGPGSRWIEGRSGDDELAAFLGIVAALSSSSGPDRAAYDTALRRALIEARLEGGVPALRFTNECYRHVYPERLEAPPAWEAPLESLNFDSFASLMSKAFSSASGFSYILVGDFLLDETINLAAGILGSIAPGEEPGEKPIFAMPALRREGPTRKDFHLNDEDAAVVRMSWALPRGIDEGAAAGAVLLPYLLKEALFDELRGKLAATYTVSLSTESFEGGFELVATLMCAPQETDRVLESMEAVADAFVRGAPGERYSGHAALYAQQSGRERFSSNLIWIRSIRAALEAELDMGALFEAEWADAKTAFEAALCLARELLIPANRASCVLLPMLD